MEGVLDERSYGLEELWIGRVMDGRSYGWEEL